uniref:BTB domain-containing protein n=1 Tax=Ditylenchus dipsaci TaxID=166011 RepID=A0A915E7E5_9BILA
MSSDRTKRYADRATRDQSLDRSTDNEKPKERGRDYFGSVNSRLSAYKSDARPSRTSAYSNRTHFKYKSPERNSRQSKSPKRPLYSFPKYNPDKRSSWNAVTVKTEDNCFSDNSGSITYGNSLDSNKRFGFSALNNSSFDNSGFGTGQDVGYFFPPAFSKGFGDIPLSPPSSNFGNSSDATGYQDEIMVVKDGKNHASFGNESECLEPIINLVQKKEEILPVATGSPDGKKNSGCFINNVECMEPAIDLVPKEEELSPVATDSSTGMKRKSLFIPPHWSDSSSVIEEAIDDVLDDYNPSKHSKKKLRSAIEGVLVGREVAIRSLKNYAQEIPAQTFYLHLKKAYSKVVSKLGSSPQISEDAVEAKPTEKKDSQVMSTPKRGRPSVKKSLSTNIVPKKQLKANVDSSKRVSSSKVLEDSIEPPAVSARILTASKLKDQDNAFCADESKVAATQVIKRKHVDYLQGRKGGTPLVLPDHWKKHKKVLREVASEAMSMNLSKNGDDGDIQLAILEVLLNVNTIADVHRSVSDKVASSAFYKCVESAKEFAVSKLGLVPKEAVLSSSEVPNVPVKEPVQATKVDNRRKIKKIDADASILPEEFLDCVVSTAQRRFTLNKMLLAIHSGFFARVFKESLRIKDMQEVKLSNVDAEEFLELISVLHSPCHKISVLNVCFLLELGRQLEFSSVVQSCVQFISTSDKMADAEKLLLSEKYNLPDLQDDMIKRFGTKAALQQLMKQSEFKLLSLNTQNRLYSSYFSSGDFRLSKVLALKIAFFQVMAFRRDGPSSSTCHLS